jgi:signal transduction histidine kinase
MRRPLAMRPLDRLTSIRAKLGAVIVFAVGATILIMYVTVGFALRQQQQKALQSDLTTQANTIVAVGFTPSCGVAKALDKVVGQSRFAVIVVDAAGRPIRPVAPDAQVPPTVGKALSGQNDAGTVGSLQYVGQPVTCEAAGQLQVRYAVYVERRAPGGGPLGAIRATAGFVLRNVWQLLLAGAVSAVIALALARWLARGMTQPIRDMAKAAESLARGDYTGRVPVTTRDELGKLAETFNRMAGELESVERLRRDLVANVSHELKTPITAIRAHLENLLDGVEEPNEATMGLMLEQSERLGRLVDQLLDLSRLESGTFALDLDFVTLHPLTDRVLREVQVGRPAHGVAVRNEVPAELPPLEVDRERIHQVLFNLVDNALRFTPAGGSIVVRAGRSGDMCQVSVEDSGPGVPEAHRPFVFERFYRVEPARSRQDGGTGIGLTIARSVVEAHGGRIWVEASEDGGAALRFTLPFATPPVGEQRVGSSGANRPDTRGEAVVRPADRPGSTRVGAHRA